MILAPYLADTVKARFLQPDGTYARAHHAGRALGSRNGTRFSVQEFLMARAEEQGMEEESLGLAPILKLRSSPIFETLLRNWNQPQEM